MNRSFRVEMKFSFSDEQDFSRRHEEARESLAVSSREFASGSDPPSENQPTWAKLAALLRHADLLVGWARQWWAHGCVVVSFADEVTVLAVAIDALSRRDLLAVIVHYVVQVTLS